MGTHQDSGGSTPTNSGRHHDGPPTRRGLRRHRPGFSGGEETRYRLVPEAPLANAHALPDQSLLASSLTMIVVDITGSRPHPHEPTPG